jgi:hypothetical protein
MEADTMSHSLSRTQLVAVLGEMDAIHVANTMYWRQKQHNREEETEYQRRQERLEQIRRECGWVDRLPEDGNVKGPLMTPE